MGRKEVMDMVAAAKPLASLGAAEGEENQGPTMQAGWCERSDCRNAAVISFGKKSYCFDHFCLECYGLLERAEGNSARISSQTSSNREEIEALDECAQRALEISLSEIELDNLDRARLLDILLWSGDLTAARRMRRRQASVTVAN
jgi:hypothetical protein